MVDMAIDSGILERPATTAHECSVSADRKSCGAAAADPSPEESAECGNSNDEKVEDSSEFLGKLPTEIGTLLMIAGVAGLVLPGPWGTPMLIAGATVVWPKTFSRIERAFAKRCPSFHREGVQQIKRFISDLNRRFPQQG